MPKPTILSKLVSTPMRMPRFRVRTLMVGVATVALLTATGVEGRRMYWLSTEYQSRATYMESAAKHHRRMLYVRIELARFNIRNRIYGGYNMTEALSDEEGSLLKRRDRDAARVWHYIALREKYERAARYPWLPVEPDPPAPK